MLWVAEIPWHTPFSSLTPVVSYSTYITMSHFTEIKTQIKDIAALKAACQELGLPLLQNTTARGYAQDTLHGDYVIKLQGPYDIAVMKQPDNTFTFTADVTDS